MLEPPAVLITPGGTDIIPSFKKFSIIPTCRAAKIIYLKRYLLEPLAVPIRLPYLENYWYSRLWYTQFFISTLTFRSKPLPSTNCAYKKPQKPLCAKKSSQTLYVLITCLNVKTPQNYLKKQSIGMLLTMENCFRN